MKASWFWLKEFCDFSESPEEVRSVLLQLGFDVPSLTPVGGAVTGVVAALVEFVEKHPNADKLNKCVVFDGIDRFSVVCGAPNVKPGGRYPFARLGARLPDGLVIEKRVLRGVESSGMLCSARELGLGADHSGLYDLPSEIPLGQDMVTALELNDVIFEVEVTPNRPDVLSHWGLAREIAAGLGRSVRWPTIETENAPAVTDLVRVDEPQLCSRYTAHVLDGILVKSSPLSVRLRLERCGIRSINNVVDVTNYVLLELGHPLHVFDRDRLHGALVVRRGSEGERLTCLDGVDRGVQDSLVIADDQGPVAVAGVMGGSVSSVQENTVRVVLESARFLPGEVRRTRNRLRLSTESSYRFERGTDVFVADLAGRRAVWLLSHWAGGQRTGQVDVGPSPEKAMAFRVSLDRLCELLGFELETQRVATLLERLQFTCVVEQNSLLITPPLHRADVRETADVVDEVARLMGYDKIPSRVRGAVPSDEDVSPRQRALGMARERLVSFGFWEAVQSGLVPRALWERWAGPTGENPPELANPLSLTGECLNPSLVVNLLSLLVSNNRQGHTDVRLFECARVFHRDGDSIKEDDHLAWVASGRDQGGHWKEPPRFLDFWDAKAWAQSLLEGWGLSTVTFLPADVPALHPKESLTFSVDGRVLGFFGRLHPKQAERWDVSHDTVVFECNLTALGVGVGKAKTFQGLSRVPVLRRDFSLVFQETVSWASITTWIHGNVDFVKAVELFDVFTGGGLPAGVRSLAFRVTFRHGERTLTDAEGQALQDRVVRGLGDQFQAKLRG